jgi:nucleotide-binding universal stress UspA family protein
MAVAREPRNPFWTSKTKGGLMTGSIICGVDDSDSAKGAARVARALAGELGLGLLFVRVVDRDVPDSHVSAIAERLQRLSAGSNELDCSAEWLVETGHAADGLVAAARKARAEMIVVGSTGPHSSLLGSISADVSRRAPCPVVVVPPGADTLVNGQRNDPGSNEDDDRDSAGGIVRFGLGSSKEHADFAGGIVRFNLGSGGR